jgi:hypothetical protein
MSCTPEGNCWCFELPPHPKPAATGGCLCRDCLRSDLELKSEARRAAAAIPADKRPLK